MSVHKSRKPFNNIPTQISTEENAAPKRKTTSLLYPKDLFISYCAGDIHKCYKFGKVLGKGAYGEVSVATHLETSMIRAIKSIKKSLINPKLGKEGVMAEFNLLKKLDHPNILRVFEAYEDQNYLYIVTELLNGGELFQVLLKEGKFNEEKAAEIVRQTLVALAYCHQNNLAHRDLKPQNLLIESKQGKMFIKLIDFGISKFFTGNANFKDALGTPLFMAPEILKQEHYDHKVDIWSLGIMTYMMLIGKAPFVAKTAKELFKSICEAYITKEWFTAYPFLSHDAIDFIVKCLTKSPHDRMEAKDLLNHAWITTQNRKCLTDDESNQIQNNLKHFNGKYMLEQAVYTYLAMNAATLEDEKNLRDFFLQMDDSKDGKISKEEFITGMLNNSKNVYTRSELEEIFEEVDSDSSGLIDYTEFLKAALDKQKLCTDEKLKAAFNFFDLDGNGFITKAELLEVFSKGNINLGEQLSLIMIKEIDKNKDQCVSFNEFKVMMISGLKSAK